MLQCRLGTSNTQVFARTARGLATPLWNARRTSPSPPTQNLLLQLNLRWITTVELRARIRNGSRLVKNQPPLCRVTAIPRKLPPPQMLWYHTLTPQLSRTMISRPYICPHEDIQEDLIVHAMLDRKRDLSHS